MNIGDIKTGDNQSIISLQKKIDKDTVVTFGYDAKGSFSEVANEISILATVRFTEALTRTKCACVSFF